MSERKNILVIGGDSLIGTAVARSLVRERESIITTTRRKGRTDAIFFDLADPRLDNNLVERTRGAIVCAGIGNMAICEKKRVNTRRINVDGVCAVAKQLLDASVPVSYISTSQVFDGSDPAPLPDDPVSPVTEYGRQRAAVEFFFTKWRKLASVVRLTKVIESCVPLFTQWLDDLQGGKKIHPYSDYRLSPLPLTGVADYLSSIIRGEGAGITHLSCEATIGYVDTARILAKAVGADLHLVEPRTSPALPVGAVHLGGAIRTFNPKSVVEETIGRMVLNSVKG